MSNQQNYRYEKKILISHLTKEQVQSIISINPIGFKQLYQPRFINNIYFDDNNLQLYQSSVEGDLKRVKIRIRWYGELFGTIDNPILEIKIKEGMLSKKVLIPLKSFYFDRQTDILKVLKKNSLDIKKYIINWRSLYPTLVNRYYREYHISFNGKFRATIDYEQAFYSVLSFNRISYGAIDQKDSVILEIKYGAENSAYANEFISRLPLRVTKSSKYVKGIELTTM